MKKKYLLLDFDGVLAESVNIKTEAFRSMYLEYGSEFSQKVVDYHLENGGVSRFEKFKIFNAEWLGQTLTTSKMNELSQVFSSLVVEGVVNAPEVKGSKDFLETSKKYIKYIITGTPTIEIKPILERRKMDHYFNGVFGSPETKGHWVKHILATDNINAAQCVFIGDALADYSAAKDNNITFVLRETQEAANLFRNFNGCRVSDMSELNTELIKMNLSK